MRSTCSSEPRNVELATWRRLFSLLSKYSHKAKQAHMAACFSDKNHFMARNVLLPYVYLVSCPDPLPFGHFKGSAEKDLGTRLMSLLIVWLQACTYVCGYTFTFRVRYLLSDTRSSRPLDESAQTWHEFVYNMDNSKSDYSKTRRIFLLPGERA